MMFFSLSRADKYTQHTWLQIDFSFLALLHQSSPSTKLFSFQEVREDGCVHICGILSFQQLLLMQSYFTPPSLKQRWDYLISGGSFVCIRTFSTFWFQVKGHHWCTVYIWLVLIITHVL